LGFDLNSNNRLIIKTEQHIINDLNMTLEFCELASIDKDITSYMWGTMFEP
jgi:hypothetical protein